MYECPHQNVNTIFFFSGSFIVFWVTCWLSAFVLGLEDHMMHKAECQMWSKLENKTLPLQDQGHANCTTNSQCTGFDCKGIYQVSNKIVHLLPLTLIQSRLFNKGYCKRPIFDLFWSFPWFYEKLKLDVGAQNGPFSQTYLVLTLRNAIKKEQKLPFVDLLQQV